MIKKIAFTMYSVQNMERARKFYEQTLGLKLSSNHENAWVEYDLAGGCFAITTMVKEIAPSADAGGSIAFEVGDVDAVTEKVRASGAKIKVPPFTTPVCKMSVVIDPEGNAVTLHQLLD